MVVLGPQGKRPPDTRSAADGILEGCQQRAYASKASLFPYPTKDQLAKALAPMLGAGSGERLTGGRPLCPDRPPATGCQPSGLDCEYAIRSQLRRMNLKSLMQPCRFSGVWAMVSASEPLPRFTPTLNRCSG